MADHRHTLAEPIDWFGKRIAQVTLRQPRGGHLQRLGEPRMSVFQSDGTRYFVDRDDKIASYFDELLSVDGVKPVEGGAAALLTLVSLEDGIALRDALFDFFADAHLAIFKKKQTSSSST